MTEQPDMKRAYALGVAIDRLFNIACQNAKISPCWARVGSPLLNLHQAKKHRAQQIERERYAKRKAARAA